MQHDNLDDRVAICLKIIRINKINNNYKGAKKNEQKRTNRNTAKRLAR
jgi:hypothetical protein